LAQHSTRICPALHPVAGFCQPLTASVLVDNHLSHKFKTMTQQLTPAPGCSDGRAGRSVGSTRSLAGPDVVQVLRTAHPDAELLRDWDRLVSETAGSDVAQLSAWANLRREQAGFAPRYLLARRDGRLVGGALVLQRRIPLLGTVGYLPYGPLVAAGEPRGPVVAALVSALHRLGRRDLKGLFVQPPADGQDVTDQLLYLGFRSSVAGIAPVATIKIDLTSDIEEIRKGLTRSNRRRTQTAADRGITVRVGGEQDLPLVTDLFASTAAHQQFEPMSLDYLQTMYRELATGDRIKIFIAELHGEPVAAELFTGCGGVLKSRLTGMLRSDEVRKSGVSAVLLWHCLVWAKADGYHTFDLGGITADMADTLDGAGTAELTGPAAFKASFGGRTLRYPKAVELVSSPVLRIGYDLSRRSRFGHTLVGAVRRFLRGGGRVGGGARGGQLGSSSR
jgi:lipid II:glycine glycyltransferase (peptidoglycan interpeptide bridge formation enzyme)